MGTRADFYVGKNKDAEWIGSIAWDGYRDGIDKKLLKATTEKQFRNRVKKFLDGRDDSTYPHQGWPWPWDTSATSDCSYWFFDGQVWDAQGNPYPTKYYFKISQSGPYDDENYIATGKEEVINFPDMSHIRNLTLGKRSGLISIVSFKTG